MEDEFTTRESQALYRLLAEQTSDVVLRTDRQGFIRSASSSIERLGFACSGAVIGRHLADLVQPAFAAAIEATHAAVVTGRQEGASAEFLARTPSGGEPWCELQLRALLADDGAPEGAVGLLRSLEDRRMLEEELFNAEMTDPLTGLTNRRAFTMMLRHLLERRIGGCLAIFSIDFFKAMNIQHGQSFGDEVLVVFSGLLRNLMRADDTISRIGGETIGVLLPAAAPDQAEVMCQRVIATLSEIRRSAGPGGVAITASVGISRIEGSLDDTIKRAEVALFMAQAKGRDRLELDRGRALPGRSDHTSLSV